MGLVPLLASPKTLETKMTGLGSPCGACKFLRRKCVRGCVFAPHFSHEQGATHFSAIHKVFGASNVSKLLMQIPMSDRSEAAITISYEAQARIQDPVYGCVGHIFALQQQVANLQAQLASLKEQVSQIHVNPTTTTTSIPHNSNIHAKFSSYQEDVHEFFHLVNPRIAQPRYLDPHCNNELSHPNLAEFQSSMSDEEQLPLGIDDDSSQGMPCIEVQMDTGRSAYEEMQNNFGDLRSVAFSFLRST